MAFLLVDSLPQNNSRFLKISVKALELLLLSTGLISTLVMVKRAMVPYSSEIVFSSLVAVWRTIKCFLSSPLSFFITFSVMVVLIVASSMDCRHENSNQDGGISVAFDDYIASPPPPPDNQDGEEVGVALDEHDVAPPPPQLPAATRISNRSTTSLPLHQGSNHGVSSNVSPNSTEEDTLSSLEALFFSEIESHEIKKTAQSLNSSQDSSSEPAKEKMVTTNLSPLPSMEKEDKVTSNHSDDKENENEDTIDATWKAIIGGAKQRPKKKHLKKTETWDVPPRRSVGVQRLDSEEVLPSTPKWKELRKSETFNDALSMMCKGGLRRDPSMSLEEFNQQVEAFIKKINHNMRLQRQESNQRFLDMVNRRL